MAFATMHFAAGMIGSGAIATTTCLITRRGWKWIPLAMTLGGLWGMIPDMPRLFREDFPWLPFASTLGSRKVDDALFSNWFFFHRSLDDQPREYALHGMAIIILLYNIAIAGLMCGLWMTRKRAKLQQSKHEAYHDSPEIDASSKDNSDADATPQASKP